MAQRRTRRWIPCHRSGRHCQAFRVLPQSGRLRGIAERAEPGTAFVGDVYAAEGLPRVPESLAQATTLLAESAMAREAFGDDVVDHYVHFARSEQAAVAQRVSDVERGRYFERI